LRKMVCRTLFVLGGLSIPRQALGSLLLDGVPLEGQDPGNVGERRCACAHADRPTTRHGQFGSTHGNMLLPPGHRPSDAKPRTIFAAVESLPNRTTLSD
jgi:hypothetical protein